MPDSISLTGFGINDPLPAVRLEINFGVGDASLSQGPQSVVLVGSKSAAGIATLDTEIYGPLSSPALLSAEDAKTLFGPGSELARMYERFIKANPSTPVYAVAITPGESAVAADGDVVLTGPATANGSIKYSLSRTEFVEIGFITGESITTIGDRLEEAINAEIDWPITASNAAGTITMTAKCLGPRGNQIRHIVAVLPITGTGITATPTASTALSGGTVNDDIDAALQTIANTKFSYIVLAHADSSNITAAATYVATEALPMGGKRQRLIVASVDTLAGAIAITTALNFSRAELIWLEEADEQTGQLAAQAAAIYTSGESAAVFQVNWDGFPASDSQRAQWFVQAPLSGEKATVAELQAALNAGVTPISVDQQNNTKLERRITTKYQTNAAPDYRVRDAHNVSVCDYYGDKIYEVMTLKYSQRTLIDNLPDGKTPASNPKLVQIKELKAETNKLTRQFGVEQGGLGLTKNAGETISKTVVERSTNTNRVNIQVPLQPVDLLHQVAIEINQVA